MHGSTIDRDANSGTSAMPPGPWLMVVGMHRSGTSAVTGALGAMGFATPHQDDRMGWNESNPDHWESVSINRFDEGLLSRMGGSWEAPPDLPVGWEMDTEVDQVSDLVAIVERTYRDPGPIVWKDPRLCLLLPYWRRVLPPPLAAVLMWRSPLAVARSLHKREGMPLANGVALWERYNRSALEHLVGVDTYVCDYDKVLDDPHAEFATIAEWLSFLPQFEAQAGSWNLGDAASMITEPTSRPLRADSQSDDELILEQQRELIDRLSELAGGHRPLGPTPLAHESGWTTALLASHRGSRTRELNRLEVERKGLETQLAEKERALDELHRSASWRMSRPLRSLAALIRG